MSLNYIMILLKTLCQYNSAEIVHTFSQDGKPHLKVSCLNDSQTIQLLFIGSNRIELYDDLEEASVIINEFVSI